MTADEIREKTQETARRLSKPNAPSEVYGGALVAALIMYGEIAAQLAELNATLRAAHPETNQPKECIERQCSYYRHYLAYGPADLTHEGFHAAEQNGTEHFKNCSRSQKGDRCAVCEGYEKRLRA